MAGKIVQLTPRQAQVIRLTCEGYSMKEVAGMLGVQPKTVETLKATARYRLGIRNGRYTAEMVGAMAQRLGLLDK